MPVDLRKAPAYSTTQVSAMLGIAERTLMRYADTQLVHPCRTPQGSQGRVLLTWSERDVQEAKIAAGLVRDLGLTVDRALPLMEQVRKLENLTVPLYLEIVSGAEIGDPLSWRVTPAPSHPDQTLLPLALAS